MKHELRIKNYLRYGDDFILTEPDLQKLKQARAQVTHFLKTVLKLELNPKHDRIIKARHGLKFLGVVIYPCERKLKKRNLNRIRRLLNHGNISSYYGLVVQHGSQKLIHEFDWMCLIE